MRESAVNWISQDDEQFDFGIVFPNPLDGRLPININRRAFTDDARPWYLPKVFVQKLVTNWASKNFFVVEEMHLLLIAHPDVGVSGQKIMQRRRSGFLCARQNEIEPVDLSSFGSKHRRKFTWLTR
jgi:hypothetical protein